VAQVLVNTTTGHVVDGHLRVELALSRHEPTVPVTYVELTAEEERLVLATLDPLAAMANAEKDALEQLLAGLSPADDVLANLLRELGEQHGIHRPLLGDPDEVPQLPDEADVWVKPGDLFLLGDHRLLCGDATDPEAVSRLLDGAEPRLLLTTRRTAFPSIRPGATVSTTTSDPPSSPTCASRATEIPRFRATPALIGARRSSSCRE
jgi:hypothetical protein